MDCAIAGRTPARVRSAAQLLCLGLAPLLAGCVQTANDFPPAPPIPVAGYAPQVPLYRLQVGDQLAIRLMLNPDLDEEAVVRPDGRISTTIAESTPAAGLTPEELAASLRTEYATELQSPRLNVVVRSFAPTRVYVAGEVLAPGEFVTVGPTLTAVQAVARAGGLRPSGDPRHVFLIRRGPGDVPVVYAVDYNGAITGSHPQADVRLAPYDVLYVPRTGVYQTYTYFNQYVQQFLPVSWGFSYYVNPVVNNNTR